MVTRENVIEACHLFLGRHPESEEDINLFINIETVTELIAVFACCTEARNKHPNLVAHIETFGKPVGPGEDSSLPRSSTYRVPQELKVTPSSIDRVLIIGACHSVGWITDITNSDPDVTVDHLLFAYAGSLPGNPPHPFKNYKFQLIQIPLRSIMPESAYFRLNYLDVVAYEHLFELVKSRLEILLEDALVWSQKIPAFVANFVVPQQDMTGRLLPRYDLRNFVFFIERLNAHLAHLINNRQNSHLLDIDQIAATIGRRYAQDDALWSYNHHGILSDWDFPYDRARLEPISPASDHFTIKAKEFVLAIWFEAVAMYRTLTQVDPVKLVCIDLDDTLWRGVLAEEGNAIDPIVVEGWPLGFIEALAFLKKRGVLLAIVSKNDEARVRDIWKQLLSNRLELSDFSIIKINWRPKTENIEEVMREANLLPRNVLFIDDNPVERASVKAAFPDLRVLAAPHYYWRRILLWSAETQVAQISMESGRRTEMIQAQVARESARSSLSREDFLKSLNLSIKIDRIAESGHPLFPRAFELLNKTNQFNTTGKRRTRQECDAHFSEGGLFWTFSVEDCFTQYGLVGVVVTLGQEIEQFVMSCRVMGLEVELAVIRELQQKLGPQQLYSTIVETSANLPCRNLFERCEWFRKGPSWYSPQGLKATSLLPASIAAEVSAR